MVSAINHGITQNLFSFTPYENNWVEQRVYDFTMADGQPAKCSFHDIGWGEISVHACYLPTEQANRFLFSDCEGVLGFLNGPVYARGWIERTYGVYLQDFLRITCKKHLVPVLAAIEVEPLGYKDTGPVLL